MDLSLHAIDLPRNWPSDGETGEPLRYAYHACRTDLADLKYSKNDIEYIDRDANNIVCLQEIAEAVADGSK